MSVPEASPRPGALPPRVVWSWLVLLTLAGLALRLAALDVVGLWWDEFVTLGRAAWPVPDLLRSLAHEGPSDVSLDSSPPLLHLLVHSSLALFGPGDVAVKLPSVAAGTLTIPVVWLVGRRLFSDRVALAAAAMDALALFPVHYSREARPYALYLLLALTALACLLQALNRGRWRDFAAFCAAGIGMLYTSYLASATLAALGLVAGWRIVETARIGERRLAGRLLGRLSVAVLTMLAAYAPWMEAHWFQMRTIAGVAPLARRLEGVSLESVLKSFAAWHYQGDIPWVAMLTALAVLGLVRFLFVGRGRSLAILGIWSLTGLAMAVALPTNINVSIRYLVNNYYLFCFLAAGGIEALAAACGRWGRGAPGAALCVCLGVAACGPTFMIFDLYAKRDSPSIKSVLADLVAQRVNVEAIRYYRPRHLKIVGDWYLRGAFQTAGDAFDRRYKRAYFLSPADDPAAAPLPGSLPVRRTFWADIAKIGLPNRAPLPLAVPYRNRFKDLSVLADAYELENMTPDLGYGTLALYDCRRPGRAVFAFAAAPGSRAGATRTALRFVRRQGQAAPPEGRIVVRAGTTLENAPVLATVTSADFPAGGSEYDHVLELPEPDAASGRVYLILESQAGFTDGFLELAYLETRPAPQSLPADGPEAWEISAASLAANTTVAPALPQGRPFGGDVLYGFGDTPRPELGLGGPADQAAYLAAFPGDIPVLALSDANGRERARYYDPLLARPYAPLGPGVRLAWDGRPAKGLWATGDVAGQTVTLGETAVALPLACPPGASLALADDGRGLARLSPDYAAPLPDILQAATLFHAVRKVDGQDALTCAGDAPCFLTYAFSAPGNQTPITGFRATWYPSVLTDGVGHNRVLAQWSVDGNVYHDLDSLRSRGDYFLYSGTMRQAARVRLPAPANRLYLRFVLSGGGARLFSSGDTRLVMECDLARTGFSGLSLPAAPALATAGGDGLGLAATAAPPVLDLDLRERR